MLLLLVAAAGCQPLPTARYTGPTNPLSAIEAAEPAVVRGQNGYDPQGLWQGYAAPPASQQRIAAPPADTRNLPPGTPGTVSYPATQPANPSAPPGTNSGRFRAAAPPRGTAGGNFAPGDVGGSIPVQGNVQPLPVVADPAVGADGAIFGNPLPPPGAVLGPADLPEADIDVRVEETETGRFMFGVGINSDAGVTGQIVIDERNFDLFRPPRRFGEILDGTAFRGAGQGFRVEAIPGDQVQRYVVNFTEPYLFDTNVSFNVSGFYYDRIFEDWDEQRLGGRIGLGYRLTPDLSLAASVSAEQIEISDPRLTTSPQLNAAVGDHDLYSGSLTMTYDTRDVPFNPTEGSMLELSFEQTFGSFDYPKAEFDYRRYFLIAQRPDGSGRHVLAMQLRAGFTGSQTPVFENFFAGGHSTIRGFDFRGASPVENSVRVGGEFLVLGSVEYRFPLTADDMLGAVTFVDFGTVEEDIAIRDDNFRVAPGVGLRIAIPAMGPAPIALDFAFPIASAPFDDEEIFSFFVGFGR